MNDNMLPDTGIPRIDASARPSPLNLTSVYGDGLANFVPETARVRYCIETGTVHDEPELYFEKAGPREQIVFDPASTRAAIVTCGGLCPGLNSVIRSVTFELYHNYGVRKILGLRYGYRGLNPDLAEPPLELTPQLVDHIHREGGTMLGTSRGAQPVPRMVDYLVENQIDILFCVGGDGTQRGTGAISDEARRRGLPIAVVGIPKTIDNDIRYVQTSFGYATAIDRAREVIDGAHMEARSTRNGVGLVKLMGRDSGFIAAGATLASQEVNFTLIPEVPFKIESLLEALRRRLDRRGHAVIAVAEGAGQNLLDAQDVEYDASGNRLHQDIGLFLKRRILQYGQEQGLSLAMKYIDPSYVIRSVAANSTDSLLCNNFARHAVHAAMAGKTGMVVGLVHDCFINVPVAMVTSGKQYVNPEGRLWSSVLASTGQPVSW